MTQKPNRKAQPPHPQKESEGAADSFVDRNRGWLIAGGTSAALAGSALFNHWSARRAEAETPPIGEFVEVDGTLLHYVDRGTGPVVVLLHGNGSMLQDFIASGVIDLAAEHHRVIAFDRPGFGYSERPRTTIWTPAAQADLIARALKKIGVGPAVVVGHSWGTMVALAMALDHREAVSGLVLLSGCYYPTARPDVVPFSMPAIPVVGDAIAHTVAPLTGRLLAPVAVKASFAPAPVSEKFADFPLAMTLRPPQVRATGADTAMMVPSALALSRRYAELDLPIIIMAGEGDLIAHINEHAEKLAAELTQADLRILPGVGHLFHYNRPEEVVTAIADLADRGTDAAAAGTRLVA